MKIKKSFQRPVHNFCKYEYSDKNLFLIDEFKVKIRPEVCFKTA